MSNCSTTVNIRLRAMNRWFREPVFVVQVEEVLGKWEHHGGTLKTRVWRDATAADLFVIKSSWQMKQEDQEP